MNYTDLNVVADSETVLKRFIEMGTQLGYSGLGICGDAGKNIPSAPPLSLHPRIDLKPRRLPVLKKEARKARNHYMITAVGLGGIDSTNWAAEDSLIDLLTLIPSSNEKLRTTTANLAAKNGTALEIPIHHLLTTTGLVRSRIIKTMRDSIEIAVHADMKVVLTNGSKKPIHLRSPRAMYHIGLMLGLDESTASAAISGIPNGIIVMNLKRLDENYILPGLEIIGDNK